MHIFEKLKYWYSKNKKHIWQIGSVVLVLASAGVVYVLYKNKKMSFEDWLKIASTEELNEVYEKNRVETNKMEITPFWMEKISHELGIRDAKVMSVKHPPNPDPNYRWTDANRWDRD